MARLPQTEPVHYFQLPTPELNINVGVLYGVVDTEDKAGIIKTPNDN